MLLPLEQSLGGREGSGNLLSFTITLPDFFFICLNPAQVLFH